MEKCKRVSNWNHALTMSLAELKREASLNKDAGSLEWDRIAQTLSISFPGQTRTGDQCRRRWDTLVKVYNHIEDYCLVTGMQDHRELDEGELASMKLATAYHQEWYDIVEQVCSQRKRKERCDRDLMLAKRRKGSHTIELPERPPNRDTLFSASTSKSVTHHDHSTPESTTTQVSSCPSLETDKPGAEEEVLIPVLMLTNENDCLIVHEVSQEPQTLESANLLSYTFPAGNGALQKEPLEDDINALLDALPPLPSAEKELPELVDSSLWKYCCCIEESETKSELTKAIDLTMESGELAPQSIEPLQDHVWDDSLVTAIAQDGGMINWVDIRGGQIAHSTRTNSSRRADSTISRPSRRWSLKVIVLKIRQCCHACGRKERVEDLEMESKQADRLKEKARKKALMPREENVPPTLDAASSTSATSVTWGDKRLQKDAERISKQSAADKKEEETRPRRAERQQLGGKSFTKCLPVGKLCAKLSRRLFPAFHGQSSH